MYLSAEQVRALELLDSRDAAVVEEIHAERFADGVAEMKTRFRHRRAGHTDG
ncbi:hypothetical protein [Pseudonocardia sp. EV170527-09]|uniref:hypothetical protein n=1 Tax=Pseudonocardia sp. EV170527-09 TaxID=2603411 RepID=UPI0013875450|nr:hypothetical protein [Pseudonocardia sp. EV170527-09]